MALTKLGSNTKYIFDRPDADILETFENKHANQYVIDFKCPEFSSLCPKTGQPDFATIYIRYIPDDECIESKSLKLYLFAFRNFGEFHEDCVNRILADCVEVTDPIYMRVIGDFRPRGGISINPVAEYIKKDAVIPDYIRKMPKLHRHNVG